MRAAVSAGGVLLACGLIAGAPAAAAEHTAHADAVDVQHAAHADAVDVQHAAMAEELVHALAFELAPALARTYTPLGLAAQTAHQAVLQRLRAPVLALVRAEAQRSPQDSAEVLAAQVIARVRELRRTAALRWPAGLRESRFRRVFESGDPASACSASRPGPAAPPSPDIESMLQSVDALFSDVPALPAVQPELALRMVDAVVEASALPARGAPPLPDGGAAPPAGDARAREAAAWRARCLLAFWWAQRALRNPPAARQQDIDAYVHAMVLDGRSSLPALPDDLGLRVGWVETGDTDYPAEANRLGLEGRTRVEVQVDPMGDPVSAHVVSRTVTVPGRPGRPSLAFERAFDEAAIRQAMQRRYAPGETGLEADTRALHRRELMPHERELSVYLRTAMPRQHALIDFVWKLR